MHVYVWLSGSYTLLEFHWLLVRSLLNGQLFCWVAFRNSEFTQCPHTHTQTPIHVFHNFRLLYTLLDVASFEQWNALPINLICNCKHECTNQTFIEGSVHTPFIYSNVCNSSQYINNKSISPIISIDTKTYPWNKHMNGRWQRLMIFANVHKLYNYVIYACFHVCLSLRRYK